MMSAHELAMTFWSLASLAKLAAHETEDKTEDKACIWHRQASILKRPLISELHVVSQVNLISESSQSNQ
jgi:hypothetical protein